MIGREPFDRSMSLGKELRARGREEVIKRKDRASDPRASACSCRLLKAGHLVCTEDLHREIARDETRKLHQRGNCM